MLWVYGHYKYFNSPDVYRRQILITSITRIFTITSYVSFTDIFQFEKLLVQAGIKSDRP